MSSQVNTSKLVAAINEWGADFAAAKVCTQNMADLTTADVFGNLPFTKDVHFVVGAKLKEVVLSSGRALDYPDVWRGLIETTWTQRDMATFQLAWKTLTNANQGSPPYLILLFGVSRTDVTGAGSALRDYLLAGPAFLEPESDWKLMGNEIKAKVKIQPCGSAYSGLTSADATAVNALPYGPATTLSATNFAGGAYQYLFPGSY